MKKEYDPGQIKKCMKECTDFLSGENGRILQVKKHFEQIQIELKKADIPEAVERKSKVEEIFKDLFVMPLRAKKGARIKYLISASHYLKAAIDSFEKNDFCSFELELAKGIIFIQESKIADLIAITKKYGALENKRKTNLKEKKTKEDIIIQDISREMKKVNPTVSKKEIAQAIFNSGSVKLSFKTILNRLI